MKLGIICPSEIAFRRFLPALETIDEVEFSGVAVNTAEERYGTEYPDDSTIEAMLKRGNEKAQKMTEQFGGKIYSSFHEIIADSEISALYMPLPPALHYKWAHQALENGKHVLVEKPATIKGDTTIKLIDCAERQNLAIHENYMFVFHEQMNRIQELIDNGEVGDIRLYRISFGFPKRDANDFRYNSELGSGAFLDAGGYTLKCAAYFLGNTARVVDAHLNYINGFDVDMFGSGTLVNNNGITAQVSFGMDNEYKCELEVWGSKGCLRTGRILTAPAGFVPTAAVKKGSEEKIIELPEDNAFRKSIVYFLRCIKGTETRIESYQLMKNQAYLMSQFETIAGEHGG